MDGFCPFTGKVQYSGPASVQAVVAVGKRRRHPRRMERYRCPHCNHWHLATHRDRRALAEKRERMLA